MKKVSIAAAALGTIMAASPAFAQDSGADFYIAGQVGYHGYDDQIGAINGGDDDGFVYGVLVGVRGNAGSGLVIGGEAEALLGTGLIDSEYALTGHVGAEVGSGSVVFVRGGYYLVDIDLANAANVPVVPAGFDDTADGWIVGLGGDFRVGQNVSLRLGLDTVEFDTVRGTAGVAFHF